MLDINSSKNQEDANSNWIITHDNIISFIPDKIMNDFIKSLNLSRRNLDAGPDSLWNNLHQKYDISPEQFNIYYMEKINELENSLSIFNERLEAIKYLDISSQENLLQLLGLIYDFLHTIPKLTLLGYYWTGKTLKPNFYSNLKCYLQEIKDQFNNDQDMLNFINQISIWVKWNVSLETEWPVLKSIIEKIQQQIDQKKINNLDI